MVSGFRSAHKDRAPDTGVCLKWGGSLEEGPETWFWEGQGIREDMMDGNFLANRLGSPRWLTTLPALGT